MVCVQQGPGSRPTLQYCPFLQMLLFCCFFFSGLTFFFFGTHPSVRLVEVAALVYELQKRRGVAIRRMAVKLGEVLRMVVARLSVVRVHRAS